MQIQSFSAIPFNSNENHTIPEGVRHQYSLMKFGSVQASRQVGCIMAEEFMSRYDTNIPLAITSAPSSTIPKASNALTDVMRRCISEIQQRRGMSPSIVSTGIKNDAVYPVDYGKLSQKEREALIGEDLLTFDIDQAFGGGRTLIVVDDLRMTGTLEKLVAKSLQKYNLPDNLTIVFFYYLANQVSWSNPELENELNFHAIKSPEDFLRIIEGGVVFNMRSIKYILKLDRNGINYLLSHISIENLHLLREGLIDSRCSEVPGLNENFWYTIALIDSRISKA